MHLICLNKVKIYSIFLRKITLIERHVKKNRILVKVTTVIVKRTS